MPFKVIKLPKRRRDHLNARLQETEFIENFDIIMDKILENDFLMGKKPGPGHENFRADFDWIILNDSNYVKILEGRYKPRFRIIKP